jgi:hypothetical protein
MTATFLGHIKQIRAFIQRSTGGGCAGFPGRDFKKHGVIAWPSSDTARP